MGSTAPMSGTSRLFHWSAASCWMMPKATSIIKAVFNIVTQNSVVFTPGFMFSPF